MILALTLLTTGNARAADTQEEAIPWYEVEVIIFSNDEQLGLQSETWPEAVDDYPYGKVIDLRLPDDPSVLEEQAKLRPVLPSPQPLPSPAANPSNPLKPVQAATPVTPPPPPKPTEIPYLMLDPSTFQLADIDRKLRQSGKYAILLHLCWRQPTLPPDQSIPVYVYDGMTEHHAVAATDQLNGLAPAQDNPAIMQGDSGSMMPTGEVGPDYPRLSGTLRLSVSRYLHMAADLHLRVPFMVQEEVPVANPAPEESEGGSFSSFFGVNQPSEPKTEIQEHEALTDFRLLESRRLRSTEIHYFDNPMFGMILVVRPYEINPQP